MYKLIEYKNTNIKGYNGHKIMIETSFLAKLDTVNKLAIKHGFIVWVTNSSRVGDVILKDTVVKPANMSNHKVGHAIDFNIQDVKTKEWYNNAKLSDNTGKDYPFLIEIDLDSALRWGGRFTTKDSIHIDDGLNITNPKMWQDIYNDIQK